AGRHHGRACQEKKSRPGRSASDEHGLPRLSLHNETRKVRAKKGSPQSALDEHSAGRCVANLEVQLQSELDLPRIVGSIARGTNFAEGRTVEIARVGDRDNAVTAEIRSVEVRMIKYVEDLRAELQAEALIDRDVLEDGKVQPVESRSGHLRHAAQSGSAGQRHASCRRTGLRNRRGTRGCTSA